MAASSSPAVKGTPRTLLTLWTSTRSLQEGAGSTVTTFWHVNAVPSRVPFKVRVKLPAAPAVTVTEDVLVALVIVPFPEIDHV